MTTPPPAADSAWRRFGRSFAFAGHGILMMLRTQRNARVHAGVTVLVIVAGFLFGISRLEWCAVVAAIALVWVMEGVNTAIEAMVDLVSPELHPLAGRAKDVAAGAVLLAALASVVIGLLVFGPRVLAIIVH